MLDQLLGALFLLFGFQWGNVKGEATPSAIATSSASTQPVNIESFETTFSKNQEKASSSWEAKRASFSASLIVISDENKRTIMETLENRLFDINRKKTALYMEKLGTLNRAVGEIQKISDSFALESKKDMSKVTSATGVANKAITDALTQVVAQADKTYIISISSEKNVKDDYKKQRSLLASDLKKVRDAVQNSRKKVGEVLKALESVMGESVEIFLPEEGVSTNGVSPTVTVTPKSVKTVTPTATATATPKP